MMRTDLSEDENSFLQYVFKKTHGGTTWAVLEGSDCPTADWVLEILDDLVTKGVLLSRVLSDNQRWIKVSDDGQLLARYYGED